MLKLPHQDPNREPDSITISVCPVTGTGLKGSGTAIKESAAVSAAIKEALMLIDKVEDKSDRLVFLVCFLDAIMVHLQVQLCC